MPRPRTINISEAALQRLTQSGYSFADIAGLYRCSQASVTRVAQRHGIDAPVMRAAAERRAAVYEAVMESDCQTPTAEIARQLGLPESTARRHRQSVERSAALACVRTSPERPMPDFARRLMRMMP